MKKNIGVAVIAIVLIALIVVIGLGLYWNHEQNPKECISLENSKYMPVYEILDEVSYDMNGPEMAKIFAVKDRCLAVVKGQDASVDKCKAVSNLRETVELIYTNAENLGNPAVMASTVDSLVSLQKDIDKSLASSCKAEYDEFNKTIEAINKLSKENKLQK